MGYSLGLGLTNECNLSCPHCYRPTDRIYRLSLDDIALVLDSVPVKSANLGTGENGLHPDFIRIVQFLVDRGVRTSLTSNGLSVNVLPDALLRRLHEVEFSFDFPTREGQDGFRGPGAWDTAVRALERSRALGVEVTVLACMMSINYKEVGDIARLAARVGANFRVNVFQPVQTSQFSMTYEQFWDGYRSLFRAASVIGCTEPIVNTVLGLNTLTGCACGRTTIRVTPQRTIIPCVYFPGVGIPLEEIAVLRERIFEHPLFRMTRHVPDACGTCPFVTNCGGGCAGRRMLIDRLNEPDPYCPFARGETLTLAAARAPVKDLIKVGSACTTVCQAV